MNTERLKNYGTRLILELLEKYEKKKGLKRVQTALNEMGKHLVVDGIIGNITINAIKSVNNKVLHKKIYAQNSRDETTVVESGTHRPSWIKEAYKELGVKEKRGSASNPRVEQYHDAVAGWASWKDDVPWCGSFVGFIMIKAGQGKVSNSFRAKSWKNYGKRVMEPVLGAIAVKDRRGGGHVGFVVGISSNGKYLYILGGNQNDEVNIKRYSKSVFTDLRVPLDYQDIYTLSIMSGTQRVTSES